MPDMRSGFEIMAAAKIELEEILREQVCVARLRHATTKTKRILESYVRKLELELERIDNARVESSVGHV